MDEQLKAQMMEWLSGSAPTFILRLFSALLVILVSIKLIGLLTKLVRNSMTMAKADVGVTNFTCAFLNAALKVLLFFWMLSAFGVNTTSLLAVLGTAGVAIGLAVQGSLSNLAGGVMILALRPFKIGDYIKEDAHGHEGTVKEISLFTTKLTTYDNKIIVLPNGELANTSLTNFANSKQRMLEVKVGITYDADLMQAKQILLDMLSANAFVLQEEPKQVYLDSFGESALIIGVRCWVVNKNVLQRRWELNEAIKSALDQAHISIPYPHRDITIHSV